MLPEPPQWRKDILAAVLFFVTQCKLQQNTSFHAIFDILRITCEADICYILICCATFSIKEQDENQPY